MLTTKQRPVGHGPAGRFLSLKRLYNPFIEHFLSAELDRGHSMIIL